MYKQTFPGNKDGIETPATGVISYQEMIDNTNTIFWFFKTIQHLSWPLGDVVVILNV